jgi:hypothetical protein
MSNRTVELRQVYDESEAHERGVHAGVVDAARKVITAEDAVRLARLVLQRAEWDLENALSAQDAARNAASCAAIKRAHAYRAWSSAFHADTVVQRGPHR